MTNLIPLCGHTEGPYHSCAHVRQVNSFIDGAYDRAGKRLLDAVLLFSHAPNDPEAFDPDGTEESAEMRMDRYFHDEMNKALVSAGLRRMGPR